LIVLVLLYLIRAIAAIALALHICGMI